MPNFSQIGEWLLEDQQITWGSGYDTGEIEVVIGDSPVAACVVNSGSEPYGGGSSYGSSSYGSYGSLGSYGSSSSYGSLGSYGGGSLGSYGGSNYGGNNQMVYLCSEAPFTAKIRTSGGEWVEHTSIDTTTYTDGTTTTTYYYIALDGVQSGYDYHYISDVNTPIDWFICPYNETVSDVVQGMVYELGGPYTPPGPAGQGKVDLTIQAPGQVLTFTSALLGTQKRVYIDGNITVTLGESKNVTLTFISAVDDVITVKDSDGNVIATVNCPEVE